MNKWTIGYWATSDFIDCMVDLLDATAGENEWNYIYEAIGTPNDIWIRVNGVKRWVKPGEVLIVDVVNRKFFRDLEYLPRYHNFLKKKLK